MEWTNEAIMIFLEDYQAEPCIWNPHHLEHRNRHKVTEAWERLHANLNYNCSLHDLKKKRDSLMASFRTLLNKKRKSIQAGELYKPSWFAYETMEKFLSPVYHCNSPTDTEVVLIKVDTDSQSVISELGDISDDGRNNDNSDDEDEKTITAESQTLTKINLPPNILIKKRSKQCEPDKRTDDPFYILNDVSQRITGREKDDCDLYGELLVKKLRRMDEDEREELMLEIDTMLLKRKRKRLQGITQNPTPSSSYTGYNILPSRPPSSHYSQQYIKEEKISFDSVQMFTEDK